MRADDAAPKLSRRALLIGAAAAGSLAAAACGRLEFLAANLPAAFGAYRRRADVAYASGARRRLDIFVPDRPAGGVCPLIVFIHGGRWSYGDKADYRFVGAALAEIGFASVLVNFRRYPHVKMAGFMQDTALAVQWALAHAAELGCGARRVYLMGHSSGAHMAALAALDPRYLGGTGTPLAGVIGLSGPYDFLPLHDEDTEDMFGPPERYAESQPIRYVRQGAPPMLLVHGLKDETVWPKNSRNLATALRAAGTASVLKLYPSLGHADTVAALSRLARGRAPVLSEIREFVSRGPA